MKVSPLYVAVTVPPSAMPVNRPVDAAAPVFSSSVSFCPGRGAKPSVMVPSVTPASVKLPRLRPISAPTAKVGLRLLSGPFARVTSRTVVPKALVATRVSG